MSTINDLALEMTGHTSNVIEAFEQWKQERAALMEFQDRNQALAIYNKRLRECLKLSAHIISELEKSGSMFWPPKVQTLVADFNERYGALEKSIMEMAKL